MKQPKLILFSITTQLLCGLFCIFYSSKIESILPFLIGIMLILIGLLRSVRGLRNRNHPYFDYSIFSKAIILVILGIFVILNKNNSISFIAVIWGIIGLNNASESLEIFFLKKKQKKTTLLRLFFGFFELFLSITLIFHPFEKIEFHIVLLGMQLIIDAIKQIVVDMEQEFEL